MAINTKNNTSCGYIGGETNWSGEQSSCGAATKPPKPNPSSCSVESNPSSCGAATKPPKPNPSSCSVDYVYDWFSSNDFFKGTNGTKKITCGMYDEEVDGDGFIIYNSKKYPVEEYFQLPDLRELVLAGAGKNTNYDINSHDVFDVGEFKDDTFQDHYHNNGEHAHSYNDFYFAENIGSIGAGDKEHLAYFPNENLPGSKNGIDYNNNVLAYTKSITNTDDMIPDGKGGYKQGYAHTTDARSGRHSGVTRTKQIGMVATITY